MRRGRSEEQVGVPPPPPLKAPNESDVTSAWQGARSDPLVSVVCHAFNHERFIADALEGFLAQRTQFAFEVIVRDDASVDSTRQLISSYAERYPAIVRPVFEISNRYSQGVLPSSCTLPLARGQFVALCEGDDYWCDAEKLQRQVDLLVCSPRCGMAIHPATRAHLDADGVWHCRTFCDHSTQLEDIPVSAIFALGTQFAPTSSYLFRAACIPRWSSFASANAPTYEDFFLECIGSQGQFAYQPQSMSVYRWGHEGSFTHSHRRADGEKLLADFRKNASATRSLVSEPGVSERDISRRDSIARRNCLRSLMRIGAIPQIALLAESGGLDEISLIERCAVAASENVPGLASAAWRVWRAVKPLR
ncbi:MAG: glycosyltransferase [Xanthomonadales bacterium]|nr:glycosyltransferase [Xanthomonadales bacterium]